MALSGITVNQRDVFRGRVRRAGVTDADIYQATRENPIRLVVTNLLVAPYQGSRMVHFCPSEWLALGFTPLPHDSHEELSRGCGFEFSDVPAGQGKFSADGKLFFDGQRRMSILALGNFRYMEALGSEAFIYAGEKEADIFDPPIQECAVKEAGAPGAEDETDFGSGLFTAEQAEDPRLALV